MGRIVIRSSAARRRRAFSFLTSASVHGSILAWVAFSGVPERPRLSLYDQEIRPYEKKIVWYRLADKLPEIAPSVDTRDSRPLRARVKSAQTLVAGARDTPNPGPMIWVPDAPPVPAPKPVDLPNVVAVAAPKLLRPFVPPPEMPRETSAPKLPEPPRLDPKIDAAPLPIEARGAKPAPRAFVPPPAARLARQAPIELPEAPAARAAVVEANALPFDNVGARPRPRDFVPPASRPGSTAAPAALPAAPDVPNRVAVSDVKLPRGFTPPPNRPVQRGAPAVAEEAPSINAAPTPSAETTMAIVGLNPANSRDIAPPPASRESSFSTGPDVRKEGASGANNGVSLLNVPGLTARGGARDTQPTMVLPPFSPTSKENLMAAARSVGGAGTVVRTPSETSAPRLREAPDPRLAGRVVYTIAIQMPNVTSYSGSWMVWFAEREPLPGSPSIEMRAPVPLRKVDPKYVAAAVAERIEGMIRLSAVIRKDGSVEQIALLHHLDDRLDQTAREALSKWQFTPALRNGSPVDVDAVFEIPFRLAPRATK
jgi:protein TonB